MTKEGFRFQQEGPYRWVTNDLRALFLVGPKTGHSWHPDSKAESEAFIAKALESADTVPSRVRFVTYTTRFNRSHWLTVEGLEETYQRAEVDAVRKEDGKTYTVTTTNVSRIAFDGAGGDFTIDGQTLKAGAKPAFEKTGARGAWPLLRRRACARCTGCKARWTMRSWTPSCASGRRARRGSRSRTAGRRRRSRSSAGTSRSGCAATSRVKDDRDVTARDIADYNLILFGDPGSNSVIARVVGQLPIRWTSSEIAIGARKFGAAEHIPVVIYPNPLNPARYVVINSGHTFGEEDFRGTNAWLYPRLGDYSVLTPEGEIVTSGFFDENWRLR